MFDLYESINAINGNQAAVCFGRGEKENDPNVHRISPKGEVIFHALMSRITGLNGFFSPIATWRFKNIIKKFQPDIVHIHEIHGYYININSILKYLKKKNIKTVMTLHCEYMYLAKGCGKFNGIKKTMKNEYPKSWIFDNSHFLAKKYEKLFDNFENIIFTTPSDWLKKRAQESFLKTKKFLTIHNGTNIDKIFYPRNTDLLRQKLGLKNKRILLAVADDIMSENKGGLKILELARRLEYKEDIVFILVGFKGDMEK